MRAHLRPLLALLVTLIPAALPGQSDGARDLKRALERLAKGEQVTGLPSPDSVTKGALTVPAFAFGETVIVLNEETGLPQPVLTV